jgi:hypothetical protein
MSWWCNLWSSIIMQQNPNAPPPPLLERDAVLIYSYVQETVGVGIMNIMTHHPNHAFSKVGHHQNPKTH